ncbi:uncharacterized protein K452DRAFT_321997 [Aplosporella prunicola CBS 121167]|uniref:Uncharacterized protein n=1 Tax=Aplosporella prunicola CBS 121167 TaxID=1176127 RepID=A0A6A6B216_9PEZI|nr:uncharacterized protein K452DRAFT_321997 [Aplosporella prunicola CBS 121167]KAF2137057.1 hypothetical protein K452DRAFT_321997 [Aplosporella prunicola CBS 121167]
MAEPPSADELEAYQMFRGGWFASDRDYSMQVTASWLVQKNFQPRDKDIEEAYMYGVARALRTFACEVPVAIDFLLQTFKKATEHFPTSGRDGTQEPMGKECARFLLSCEIDNWVEFDDYGALLSYNGYNGELDQAGNAPSQDISNPSFSVAEVNEKLNQPSMFMTITPEYLVDEIFDEDPEDPGPLEFESEVKFIGGSLFLRAYAGTFEKKLQQQGRLKKLERYKELFSQGLITGNDVHIPNTFAVKANTELVLRNLRNGPRDETSEELFKSTEWVSF